MIWLFYTVSSWYEYKICSGHFLLWFCEYKKYADLALIKAFIRLKKFKNLFKHFCLLLQLEAEQEF